MTRRMKPRREKREELTGMNPGTDGQTLRILDAIEYLWDLEKDENENLLRLIRN